MLHVILIDDEPLIRNGLQKMFSWEDFHMEISAVFPNGSLAFEYIQTHPVDLAFQAFPVPVRHVRLPYLHRGRKTGNHC